MNFKVLIAYLLITFSCYSTTLAQLIVAPEMSGQDIINQFDFIDINLEKNQFSEVINNDQIQWQSLSEIKASWGPGSSSKLLRLKFKNTQEEPYKLVINYVLIPKIKAWVFNEDTTYSYQLGSESSYFNKGSVYAASGYVLDLPKHDSEVFIFFQNEGHPVNTGIYLFKESSLKKTIHDKTILTNIFRAVYLLFVLVSILTFIVIKEKIYLYYFILYLGAMLPLEADSGLILLITKNEIFTYVIRIVGNAFFVCFSLLFYSKFVKLYGKHLRFIKKTILGFVIVNSMIFLSFILFSIDNYLVNTISTYLSILMSSASIILSLLMIGRFAYRGTRLAKSLFIAQFINFLLGFMLFTIPSLGFKDREFMTMWLTYFLNALQAFIFLIFMVIEFVNSEKEKKKLKLSILDIKDKSNHAIIEGEQKERQRISQRLTKDITTNLHEISDAYDITESKDLLQNTIDEVRTLSHHLLLPSFEEDEFEDVILDLFSKYNNTTLKCFYHIRGWENVKISTQQHIYRIVQEVLNVLELNKLKGKLYVQFVEVGQKGVISIEWSSEHENSKEQFTEMVHNIKMRIFAIGAKYEDQKQAGDYYCRIFDIELSDEDSVIKR
ncbi:7TM diverse intracellular signaling domain-containing protein [Flammeovirga agarivorans]|uniref:7TM-DISM receptor extracellular domain-containing protein n=1 Tax=Flammeovirga agarivorans TaxID=2726742 RepID=A0A7X8XXY9_9BACT|nr:hypothetical protein [Flammeovirga agarivorans]NLR93603.1 hypothetical protein [Flammeovirga agarivorans]